MQRITIIKRQPRPVHRWGAGMCRLNCLLSKLDWCHCRRKPCSSCTRVGCRSSCRRWRRNRSRWGAGCRTWEGFFFRTKSEGNLLLFCFSCFVLMILKPSCKMCWKSRLSKREARLRLVGFEGNSSPPPCSLCDTHTLQTVLRQEKDKAGKWKWVILVFTLMKYLSGAQAIIVGNGPLQSSLEENLTYPITLSRISLPLRRWDRRHVCRSIRVFYAGKLCLVGPLSK